MVLSSGRTLCYSRKRFGRCRAERCFSRTRPAGREERPRRSDPRSRRPQPSGPSCCARRDACSGIAVGGRRPPAWGRRGKALRAATRCARKGERRVRGRAMTVNRASLERLDPELAAACRRQVDRAVNGYRRRDRPVPFDELLEMLRQRTARANPRRVMDSGAA